MQDRQLYRFTVYIDDSSKLCGYDKHVFAGHRAVISDDVMGITTDPDSHVKINWNRVRWYTCEPLAPWARAY